MEICNVLGVLVLVRWFCLCGSGRLSSCCRGGGGSLQDSESDLREDGGASTVWGKPPLQALLCSDG